MTATDTDVGTRQRLLDAAAEVFAEKGYERAGVQEIARRAGLTTGAIYSRFSGKAQLLAEAIEAHTHSELDDLFAQHRFEGEAADILTTVGSHLVTRHSGRSERDRSQALLLEAFTAARHDHEVRDALQRNLADRASRLAVLVEEAKASGDVDPGLDTEAVVRFCHAVGLGFLLTDAINFPMPAAQPWEDLITRLVGALGTGPTASSSSPTTTSTTTSTRD